jgi:transmembrane protein 222
MNSTQAKPYAEINNTEDEDRSTHFESTRKPTQVIYQPSTIEAANIDADKARFPYCIVWTPLPLISWFLPFIGHTGIAMSNGIIHDFAGPYTITIDDLAFGETHKYVPLDIGDAIKYD